MKNRKKDGLLAQDGRRNNAPPKHGQIKKGEVRNPNGRRGKPKESPFNALDQAFWDEAQKFVSRDADGPVTALKRLVQEEFYDAFQNSDVSARTRLLAQLMETADRMERDKRQFIEHVIERKMTLQNKFYQARKAMLPLPDVVPHPDHVHVSNGTVTILGPIDHAGREAWELLKAAIRVAACLHEILRTEFRREPTDTVREQLKAIEAHRRSLMRKVPKGWNWREEIYCRGSQLDFVKETVRNLERIGYVAPDAED